MKRNSVLYVAFAVAATAAGATACNSVGDLAPPPVSGSTPDPGSTPDAGNAAVDPEAGAATTGPGELSSVCADPPAFNDGGLAIAFAGPGPAMGGGFPSPQPIFGATVTAKVAPPPISGGTLLALADGNTVVAADPDRDVLYVVNVAKGAVAHTIALQPGDEPGRLVQDGAGRVHVALRSGGALVAVDPTGGTIVARRPVCPAPRGVAWDKSTDLVWVACATGELVALPSSGGAAVQTRVVERDLRDVLVRNGSLDITKFRSAQVLHVGTGAADGVLSRDTLAAVSFGQQPHVLWRAVEGPSQSVVTVHQEHSTEPIPTHFPGGYSGFGPDAGPLTSRCTMLGADGSVQSSTSLGAVLPVDVAVSPDGSFAVVVSPGDAFNSGLPVLVLVGLPSPADRDAGFGAAQPVQPSEGLAALADGGFTLASPGFGGKLGPPQTFLDAGPVGPPGGPALGPPVPSIGGPSVGGQPVAVVFDGSGHLLVQTREPAKLWVIAMPNGSPRGSPGSVIKWPPQLGGRTEIVLSTISRADSGHDIFHAAAGALIACASCHPEGGDDGHVWMLDGLPRRTPSLRGTIAGTAPYHWPGDEKDLAALAQDVYTGRMNGPNLALSQMGALTSWLEAIPAPPAPSWVDPAAAQRGRALFERADTACAACHSGPKFTNNKTVDVGTGAAFQVPPLVGVGWRTPLLHNGLAKTLGDRFTTCSTKGHGVIASLSAQDIADLTAYLETL